MNNDDQRILITGATGYVGGRLLSLLEQRDMTIRCLTRRPEYIRGRLGPRSEAVAGDVLEIDSLRDALKDVHTAYYLVHSMGSSGSFELEDRQAAKNFAMAARETGVKRIIYLGGLGDDREQLSPHLRSRHEVGRLLKESGCTVIEFRASIVIGSGSLSFELVRALVRRLPVMICPKWVSVKAQPIAIEDLLEYLVAALELDAVESRIFEIGGPDQVSYGEIMREYARFRGLKRWFLSVPIRQIGGKRGWYYADFLWTVRGWIDLVVGGIGKRRARRDPEQVRIGDVLDWWRVEDYVANQRLRLAAEMKVPGRAWLEFEVEPTEHGSSIRQTAIFDPIGVAGLAYWYSLFPLHALIFQGMLSQIASRAVRTAKQVTDADSRC